MKKGIITIIIVIVSTIVYAGPIKVTEGKTNYTKETTSIIIKFNWANAQYDYKMPLRDQLKGDYESYLREGEQKFIKEFCENSSRLTVVAKESEAKYCMSIEVTNMDKYFSAMSFVPGMKYKIWAIITITDLSDQSIKCKFNVKEFVGGRDFEDSDAFTECLGGLGKKIAKP